MTAKELLLQYENDRHREKRLRDFISIQRNGINSLGMNIVWIPKSYKEELSRQRKKLTEYEERLLEVSDRKRKIHDLITGIPGVEGEILTRRYINGEIWETVCEGVHYSWCGVFKLHERALQMVQDRLDRAATIDT